MFDCFGVLYVDARDYFYETARNNFEVFRRELQELERQRRFGFIDEAELTAAICALTGCREDELRAHPRGKFMRNGRLVTYIDKLRQAGYKTALLSNVASAVMTRYFSKNQQRRLFDSVVLSGDVGLSKPHASIYDLTAERLGVTAGHCLFIDDSIDNCQGAELAGMQVIHYQTYPQAMKDLKIMLDNGK